MIRDIRIKPVLNGFIVDVGCQTVVFDDIDKMILELSKYLREPSEVEFSYLNNALNAGKIKPRPPVLVEGGTVQSGGMVAEASEDVRAISEALRSVTTR